jgi:hypothetical protein
MKVIKMNGGPSVFNGRVLATDAGPPGSKVSLSLVTKSNILYSVFYEVGSNNRDCYFLNCKREGKSLSGPGYV